MTTQEGEINHWVDVLLHRLPEWVKKPLYDCVTCMSSIHSLYIYWTYMSWYYGGVSEKNILVYVVYVFGLACVNTLIYVMIRFFGTNIQEK